METAVEATLALGRAAQEAEKDAYPPEYNAGFARTDALARIGNQIFASNMRNNANLVPATAPVRFPQLWDASWLDWVQYNSSIADPLVRNIGESLGVRAVLKLYGEDRSDFNNTVDVAALRHLEELLSGLAPFEGLTSPPWPDVFPDLDPAKVAEGERLYGQLCESCHLPSLDVLKADLAAEEPQYWETYLHDLRLLKVTDVALDTIGTDRRQALDFQNRTADSGFLGQGQIAAGVGLQLVTERIAQKFFADNGIDLEEQLMWRAQRDPSDPKYLAVRASLYYKARPLNGAWAIAPYLHNGSVPNLFLLLSPVSERPTSFYTGSKRFDPVNLGYEFENIEGGYLFETAGTGNSNAGHEFVGDGTGEGVIGQGLSEEQRLALIEYVKSL